MQPEPVITETKPPSDLKRHIHVRTSVLLLFVAAGALAILSPLLISQYRSLTALPGTTDVPAPLTETKAPQPEVLGGKIYLSLAPTSAKSHYSLNIYSYDVASSTLQQETGEAKREYLTSDISPDGKYMAVASILHDGVVTTSDTNLFIHDLATSEVTEVFTPDVVPTKRTPHWSQDSTHIVFSVLRKKDSDMMIPDNWDVYTYTLGEKTAQLKTSGANPKFLPSGDIVILKSNGINVYTVANNTETVVVPMVGGPASISMKFDVSNDGTKLAFSTASTNEVRVYQISAWTPFKAASVMVVPASAFWPVFSPQGDYLAMQVFDWSDETPKRTPINQRLGILSLKDNKWLNIEDLTPYHQDMLFITDWQPSR